MKWFVLGLALAAVLLVPSAQPAGGQEGEPGAEVALFLHQFFSVFGTSDAVGPGDPLALDDDFLDLLDDGLPQNAARPAENSNFPPIVDLQRGVAVRVDIDLAELMTGIPCAGGPIPPAPFAFGCPTAPIDPSAYADGALLLGTQLGGPVPAGGLPENVGLANLFSRPGDTPFTGPWPFAGATGAIRFVPGGPVEKYLIGPDGLSFTGPFDPPVFVVAPEGGTWVWTFVPSDLAERFDGIQFHLFLDNSNISDTIPGGPGDAVTVAPFDFGTLGSVTLAEPPPRSSPPPPPVEDPAAEPADDARDTPLDEAPPVVETDDGGGSGLVIGAGLFGLGVASVVGGTMVLRSRRRGPCDELAALAAAARDECAQAAEDARLAREAADRAREALAAAEAGYPPSGFPASGATIDIDGEQFTGRDMQLLDWDRRVHAPSASLSTRGQTATDIARNADEARQRLDELRSQDAERSAEIDALRAAADQAEADVRAAEQRRDEACARAAQARGEHDRRCPGNGSVVVDGGAAGTLRSDGSNGAVATPTESASPAGWPELVAREQAVQTEIAGSMQALGEELARAYAGFGNIATTFATPYRRAIAGTTVLDELAAEARVDIRRAETADLVLAFVQLTNLAVRGVVGGVRLGIRCYQWFTKAPEVLNQVARVADEAITPMGRPLTGPLLPEPPPMDVLSFADRQAWVIARLAEQLGMTVEQAMARGGRAASPGEIIDLLKGDLVAARGFMLLSDGAQMVLDRVVFNVRAASRGQLSGLSRADLRQFFQWVDQGILRDLPRAADPSTVFNLTDDLGRVLGLFDDAELALLRLVAESPELRRAAFDAPTTFGSVPDAVRLADGRTVGVLVDDAVTGIWRLGDEVPGAAPSGAGTLPGFGSRFLDSGIDVPVGATIDDARGVTGVVRTFFGDTILGTVGDVPTQIATLPPGADPVAVARANPLDVVVQVDGTGATVVRPPHLVPPDLVAPLELSGHEGDDLLGELRPWLPAADGPLVVLVRPGGVGLTGWPATVAPAPADAPVIDLGLPGPPIRGLQSGLITTPTPEQVRLALELLDRARSLASGMSAEANGWADLLPLSELTMHRAGGWDRLVDTVVATPHTYVLPFGPLDAGLLRAAIASGGDGAVLAEGMGPVPANLLAGAEAAGPVLRSMAELGAFDVAGLIDERASFQELFESLGGAGVTDLQGYVDQFLRDSTQTHGFNFIGLDLEAGSAAAEFGWTFVKLLSEPITTLTQYGYEGMADELLGEYLAVHGDDFVEMIGTVDRAIGFLQGFGQAIDRHLDTLGPQRDGLATVLDDLREAGHDQDREAHVARKHADLGRSMASLAELRALVDNIAGWLDALVSAPEGSDPSLVTTGRALGLLNPTSILRMMSAVLTLGDAIGKVLLVAPPPRTQTLSPENEAIYQRQQAAIEAALRERERVESMTGEEYERWEAEQRARRERELDALDLGQ